MRQIQLSENINLKFQKLILALTWANSWFPAKLQPKALGGQRFRFNEKLQARPAVFTKNSVGVMVL
jgi:hypothetical protein